MFRYILRRILLMIPLLIGITLVSFFIMKAAPGDFLTQKLADPRNRPETIIRLRHLYHLDQPAPVQYFWWLYNICHGQFGYSFAYKQPVFHLIGAYVEATLLLALTTIVFSWLIGIPMGVLAAINRNKFLDRFISTIAFCGVSLPGFFVALLAMLWAQKTGWLPIGGFTSPYYDDLSPTGKFLDIGEHLILPTLVLGTRSLASIMRQMRGSLLDVMNENFVTAARARGLSESKVIWRHAVRNSLNPLITLFGYDLSGILAGAALVETVMDWPGLGRLLLQAVLANDLYLVMGSFLMGGVLLILGNLIADILLAVTDPRIRLS